jgi:hypothetical protein
MKLITLTAALAALALSGCATLLDSMTTLDETTASQEAILVEVLAALADPGGATLPDQLARTEEAVFRLAGGPGEARSLADLANSLEQTNEAVRGMSSILEGVLVNTESLVWPKGEVPTGEAEGGSILGGVYTSTAQLSALVPERPTQMLLAGAAFGILLMLLIRRR